MRPRLGGSALGAWPVDSQRPRPLLDSRDEVAEPLLRGMPVRGSTRRVAQAAGLEGVQRVGKLVCDVRDSLRLEEFVLGRPGAARPPLRSVVPFRKAWTQP
jgi:hypothetical protein